MKKGEKDRFDDARREISMMNLRGEVMQVINGESVWFPVKIVLIPIVGKGVRLESKKRSRKRVTG